MARWSDVMKLSEFRTFRDFIDGHAGCYRIGHYRNAYFSPRYIGRATNLWNRIQTYMDPARCHNSAIHLRLSFERHNLWFQVIRTPRFHGLEARQQAIHGIGGDGVYEWNSRVEWTFIDH